MMDFVIRYIKIVFWVSGLLDLLLLCRFTKKQKLLKELQEKNRQGRAARKSWQEFFYRTCGHQKELSRVKHDLNNNLQILYTLVEAGETQKAQGYLKEMTSKL